MLYRPGCCRAKKRSRTRGRPEGPSGADHHGRGGLPGRGGAKGPPEPQVLIASGAVAGGGPIPAPFRRSPLGRGSTPPPRREEPKSAQTGDEEDHQVLPGVKALSDVDFRLMKGEVHAIMGQNDAGSKPINIVELQGTTGSAPAIDRKTGLEKGMKAHPNWKITRSQTGNFTMAEGKQVMEAFLKADKSIQVLYAHNDGMALGAIQAIKEAGLKPGKDIIIVGVDAVKGAFEAMVAGEMNCSLECNPLLGPQALQAVRTSAPSRNFPPGFGRSRACTIRPTRQRHCRPASINLSRTRKSFEINQDHPARGGLD